MNTIMIVRITQILIDNGWQFIDNSYNFISMAIKPDEYLPVEVHFNTVYEFEEWLEQMAIAYLVERRG